MDQDLKARRILRFSGLPVRELSATTRKLFKRWNIRTREIILYEQRQARNAAALRKAAEKEKKRNGVSMVTMEGAGANWPGDSF